MFPDADIFTLIADPESIPPNLKGRRITQSFLGRLPWSGKLHRHLLPLYPMAVEQLDLQDYDSVITSDAGPMKGNLGSRGSSISAIAIRRCDIYGVNTTTITTTFQLRQSTRSPPLRTMLEAGLRRRPASVAICSQFRECV